MRLVSIPEDRYDEYRLDAIFDCYKWDPQFKDNNTVAKHVLVISKEEHEELQKLTEQLEAETRSAEEFLNNNLEYTKPLQLPKKLASEIKKMNNYDPNKHVRLMRYDLHPTVEGKWALSEVNSDVPGGFAEASLLPQAAMKAIGSSEEQKVWSKNFGNILMDAIASKVKENGRIMLVHCTSYSDDRQVMQFLGDGLQKRCFEIIYGAADNLIFKDNKAFCILDGNEGELDGIVRFSPLEWVTEMKPKNWGGYFDTVTTCCNHPIAIFAQTKRFPFVWDDLEKEGIKLETWRKLLPETIDVKDAKGKKGYIYKPVYGRVGENISIREACEEKEYEKIIKTVKKFPKEYLAQKKFISKPLEDEKGNSFHVCIGSYSVDGKHGGYYARISKVPRIDSNAADIPVLIER